MAAIAFAVVLCAGGVGVRSAFQDLEGEGSTTSEPTSGHVASSSRDEVELPDEAAAAEEGAASDETAATEPADEAEAGEPSAASEEGEATADAEQEATPSSPEPLPSKGAARAARPRASAPAQPEAPPEDLLTDPGEIQAMITRVVSTGEADLKACYTARQAEREDLLGAWKISLSVGPRGAEGVRVQPLGMSDDDFESCMRGKVGRWAFEPVESQVDVVKSFRFGPGF